MSNSPPAVRLEITEKEKCHGSLCGWIRPARVEEEPGGLPPHRPVGGKSVWITYKSKADQKRIMKKVMEDPRLAKMMDPANMPFDMKRMAWAGFKPIVEA
jgi:hypothetical protein